VLIIEREMLGVCCVINWSGKETLKFGFYKKKSYKNLKHDITRERENM
jgi:hypothetical protein